MVLSLLQRLSNGGGGEKIPEKAWNPSKLVMVHEVMSWSEGMFMRVIQEGRDKYFEYITLLYTCAFMANIIHYQFPL